MAVNIFFCYAHEDESLLNKLKKHLLSLQKQGLVSVWHDREISAGAEWQQKIGEQLNTAQIILLLVSPDFIASDYCYSVEAKRAMERHERGEALVIPVILRPTLWKGTPFGKLEALPTNAHPIVSAVWHNEDEAFLNVAQAIQDVVEKLSANQLTKSAHSRQKDSPTAAPLPLDYIRPDLHLYSQPWSRQRPGLLILLLDQSKTMNESATWNEYQISLAQMATLIINDLLLSVVENASLDPLTGRRRDYCEIAIFGYGDQVVPLLISKTNLPVSISDLAENPLGQHHVRQTKQDPLTHQSVEFVEVRRYWIRPFAQGSRTEMALALNVAFQVVQKWLKASPVRQKSFPPIVINITGGKHNSNSNNNPIPEALELQQLHTDDGNVLLFNCYVARSTTQHLSFPSDIEQLQRLGALKEDQAGAQQLFEMSSLVPSTMVERAYQLFGQTLLPGARGFLYGANGRDLIKFLSWGTRQNTISQQNANIWPTTREYETALQNAHITVYDHDLKHGKLLQDVFGPLRLNAEEGKSSCVYKIGDWVVKCFTNTPAYDIQERYKAINHYLEQHRNQLPFLVPQIWVEKAIRINNQDWPFIKAPYVKGIPLGAFLEKANTSGDKQSIIAKLAKQWLTITTALESLGIAHGDLDITNVLVYHTLTRVQLRLIDFDCMYVPTLATRRLPEQGHEHFQPQQPGIRHFNREMDRFSALVIYISLLALAEESVLWTTCRANSETKLLLGKDDFQNLRASKAYQQLRTLQSNRELQRCLDELALVIIESRMPRSLPEIFRSSQASYPHPIPATHDLGGGLSSETSASLLSPPVHVTPKQKSSVMSPLFENDPLFTMPQPIKARLFTQTKGGDIPFNNEDACAISQDETRFALCDGASGSNLSRPWATLLANQWIKQPLLGTNENALEEWLDGPREKWHDWVHNTWLPKINARNHDLGRAELSPREVNRITEGGAAATFLGLILDRENNTWSATAVGDVCLFHFYHKDDDALSWDFSVFPLSVSTDFNDAPGLIKSRRGGSSSLANLVKCQNGRYRSGDALAMATDALANWLLAQLEKRNAQWRRLLDIESQEDFNTFIAQQRTKMDLFEDDTTLLIISL